MGRRAKLSLKELKQKCDALSFVTPSFELLADSVVITDTDANILYANQAAEEKTGYSLEEMLAKNPGDLWGGHMPKEIYREMYHAIKELKTSWHGQVKNRRKDGSEYWQWLRVNPILDSKNECLYFVAIEPDIDNSGLDSVEDVNKSLVQKITLSDTMQSQQIKIDELTKAVEQMQAKLNKKQNKEKS